MKKRKYRLLIILTIIALSLPVGITFSRYVSRFIKSYIMEANNFFFNSSLKSSLSHNKNVFPEKEKHLSQKKAQKQSSLCILILGVDCSRIFIQFREGVYIFLPHSLHALVKLYHSRYILMSNVHFRMFAHKVHLLV